MKRFIDWFKCWWKRMHCEHLYQYKESRMSNDGNYKVVIYECPYCGSIYTIVV